jgi:hypothetical protein
MADDLPLTLGLLLWVACIPTLSLYGLISPCGLMDLFLLVDKDYVSHLF